MKLPLLLLGVLWAIALSSAEVPRIVCLRPPEYPPIAVTAQIAGDVTVTVKIGSEGKVQSVDVISGPSILRQPTVENVKNWMFERGRPEYFKTVFSYRFSGQKIYPVPAPHVELDLPHHVTITSRPMEPQP